MKKLVAFVILLASCGSETKIERSEPRPPVDPPTDPRPEPEIAKYISCSHVEYLEGQPERQVRYEYRLTKQVDRSVSMSFKVTYKAEGQEAVTGTDSKEYASNDDAAMHATASVGPYVAYSDDEHVHIYKTYDKSEIKVTCEVTK